MKHPFFKKLFPLLILAFLLIILPLSLQLIKEVQYLLTQALGRRANIVVDVSVDQGPIIPVWQALAQGGEEKYPFENIVPEISVLKPRYIRIDHLYDFYEVVKKQDGKLIFNWSELDKVVNQILKTGATPFFSLSYMPPAIAQNGEITAPPNDWNEWSTVVRETIQHFSGRQGRNLTNVIYEVWNEPDLFGQWKIGGEKDYRQLYKYAVLGANQTKNTNPFKIGGPGITAPYKAWVDGFLDYTIKNKLRIDFYSWHRYTTDPKKFQEDVDKVDSWLFQNAGYTLSKFLTEWGSVSENSPLHDSNFDAAHLAATVRQLVQRVDLAFTFEIKDGPSPEGKKYWGRWGLLTHEKAGAVEKKPKYWAYLLLNKMMGNRISLEGEGTWVTGFASKDDNKIKIILVNFDQNSRHFETIPLTINNLENGNYSYKESFLVGARKTTTETITTGTFRKEIPLSANNIVVIELTKI
jgi:beta-xylosidase